jgi:hypothetical protein
MIQASDYIRLAEDDGARFCQIRTTGLWGATDRDGMVIVPYVDGAMSREEAARLYCEEKGLGAYTPETILARIVREYRPYDALPAFGEGFTAYQAAPWRNNPYDKAPGRLPGREGESHGQALLREVDAQAWDRGANAAMLYARALAHLDSHPEIAETPPAGEPGWLVRLLRNGRG